MKKKLKQVEQDVTRSPKQGYQWSTKIINVLQKSFKKWDIYLFLFVPHKSLVFSTLAEIDPDAPKCFKHNGGCQHLCSSVDDSTVRCSCVSGFQLNPDGSTCRGTLFRAKITKTDNWFLPI